jgi:hypothetical protein
MLAAAAELSGSDGEVGSPALLPPPAAPAVGVAAAAAGAAAGAGSLRVALRARRLAAAAATMDALPVPVGVTAGDAAAAGEDPELPSRIDALLLASVRKESKPSLQRCARLAERGSLETVS